MEKSQEKSFLRKRVERGLKALLFTAVVTLLIWLVQTIVYLPYFSIEDESIVRKFSFFDLSQFEKEPTNRNVPWDSEIPTFVEKDIQYASKKNYDIVYSFKDYVISIYPQEDHVPVISVHAKKYDYSDYYYSLENFSIYRNKNRELVIYGHYSHGDCFMRYLLGKEDYSNETLTYDRNIPFDLKDYSIASVPTGEYSVFWEEDSFYFYKDGKEISSQKFPIDVSKADLYNGLILTTNNQLYTLYVHMEGSEPKITYTHVGKIDKIAHDNYIVSEDGIHLPIVEKNNEKYILVPNDWETFRAESLSNSNLDVTLENPDYTANLILLEDLFKSANIKYKDRSVLDTRWCAEICFDLNGVDFFDKSFDINGYDSSISLPEEIYTKYEKTVYSLNEFWNHIKTIRTLYFDYYDYEGI